MNLAFSRRLAIAGGVLLPALETLRRWDEFPGPVRTWTWWLDDYYIGVFLLIGAWRCWREPLGGRTLLAAAWGFAVGIGLLSLMGQVEEMLDPVSDADPSGLPHSWMIAIKATLLTLGIAGLIGAVRQTDPSTPIGIR